MDALIVKPSFVCQIMSGCGMVWWLHRSVWNVILIGQRNIYFIGKHFIVNSAIVEITPETMTTSEWWMTMSNEDEALMLILSIIWMIIAVHSWHALCWWCSKTMADHHWFDMLAHFRFLREMEGLENMLKIDLRQIPITNSNPTVIWPTAESCLIFRRNLCSGI